MDRLQNAKKSENQMPLTPPKIDQQKTNEPKAISQILDRNDGSVEKTTKYQASALA